MLYKFILRKQFIKKIPRNFYSSKFRFDGKTYKISVKKSIFNMRFNKSNKNILVFKNLIFKDKLEGKKLYCNNAGLIFTKFNLTLRNIRLANTYTLRGIWTYDKIIYKRTGRISEYF